MMESVVSGHRFNATRERLADKLELIKFDPFSKSSETTRFFNLPIICFSSTGKHLQREKESA